MLLCGHWFCSFAALQLTAFAVGILQNNSRPAPVVVTPMHKRDAAGRAGKQAGE